MKKKMSYIIYIFVVLSAIHWFMRQKNGADKNGKDLLSRNAFWKKDKFYIPQSAIHETLLEKLTYGESVLVFQSSGDWECFLGGFVFLGYQKNTWVLRGNKSISASKLDKHFSIKNQKTTFKLMRLQEHFFSKTLSCKEWIGRVDF